MTLPQHDPQALAKIAVELLHTLPHIVIATSDTQSRPWAVPVHHTFHDDGTLTWLSSITTRHSQNIVENRNMSATMYELAEHGEVSLFLAGYGEVKEDTGDGYAVYQFTIEGYG